MKTNKKTYKNMNKMLTPLMGKKKVSFFIYTQNFEIKVDQIWVESPFENNGIPALYY